MIDFLRNELNIGDKVVTVICKHFFQSGYRFRTDSLCLCEIEGFTKTMVILKPIEKKDNDYSNNIDSIKTLPYKVAKVEIDENKKSFVVGSA